MSIGVDLTGKVFTRWTVLQEDHFHGKKYRKWICRCACGAEKSVIGSTLVSGLSTSCGCKKTQELVGRLTIHGKTKVPGFKSWCAMIDRCTNPRNASYKHYGGKGITVAPEWVLFEQFFVDMGERPKGTSLDRLDSTKGYCKDNCRWATAQEQAMGKSNGVSITAHGVTLSQREWARKLGITDSSLAKRLRKWGNPELACTATKYSTK